jgi:hypothetical protein
MYEAGHLVSVRGEGVCLPVKRRIGGTGCTTGIERDFHTLLVAGAYAQWTAQAREAAMSISWFLLRQVVKGYDDGVHTVRVQSRLRQSERGPY